MEFQFNINSLLGDEITLIDNGLTPHRNNPSVRSENKKQLREVIDKVGVASAKAQNLHGPITTSSKLMHSDHHLFVMKEEDTASGNGAVVGILKVGHKKLFVYDNHGGQHEMDPLCILDFYVHESRQRKGCGKKLFEAMMKHENVKPVHLAIDRPSQKFLQFLQKHYHLKATITQVNNYVIFEGFFRDRPVESRRGRGGKPPIHTYRSTSTEQPGRNVDPAVQKREGSVRSSHSMTSLPLLSWQPEDEAPNRKEALSHVKVQRSTSRDSFSSGGPGSADVAKQGMYSRHSSAELANQGAAGRMDIPVTTQRPPAHEATPPLMRKRDGPAQDFQAMSLNNARAYQNSRGHLIVESAPGEPTTKQSDPIASHSAQQHTMNSSWNVFGVPPRHTSAQRQYAQTRLW